MIGGRVGVGVGVGELMGITVGVGVTVAGGGVGAKTVPNLPSASTNTATAVSAETGAPEILSI